MQPADLRLFWLLWSVFWAFFGCVCVCVLFYLLPSIWQDIQLTHCQPWSKDPCLKCLKYLAKTKWRPECLIWPTNGFSDVHIFFTGLHFRTPNIFAHWRIAFQFKMGAKNKSRSNSITGMYKLGVSSDHFAMLYILLIPVKRNKMMFFFFFMISRCTFLLLCFLWSQTVHCFNV